MNPLVHTILITTATGDGQILGLTRTRTSGNSVLADMLESNDIECFASTPVNDKEGIQHEIITQRTPSYFIPDRVWHEFYDLLCMRLHMQAALRNTTTNKDQENLGDISNKASANSVGLVLCMPRNATENQVIMNGTPMPEVLQSLGFNTTPEKIEPKPPTWDPHYKDSPYPDDFNELPSDDMPF